MYICRSRGHACSLIPRGWCLRRRDACTGQRCAELRPVLASAFIAHRKLSLSSVFTLGDRPRSEVPGRRGCDPRPSPAPSSPASPRPGSPNPREAGPPAPARLEQHRKFPGRGPGPTSGRGVRGVAGALSAGLRGRRPGVRVRGARRLLAAGRRVSGAFRAAGGGGRAERGPPCTVVPDSGPP